MVYEEVACEEGKHATLYFAVCEDCGITTSVSYSQAQAAMDINRRPRRLVPRKILVCGLPGSGKTTLAGVLAARLDAVHFNADYIREHINTELGFDVHSRVEQAYKMGALCDTVKAAGHVAIADFICPTVETRNAFSQLEPVDWVIWMNTIGVSRFEDTNRLFVPPTEVEGVTQLTVVCEQNAERIVTDLVKEV